MFMDFHVCPVIKVVRCIQESRILVDLLLHCIATMFVRQKE